MLGLRIVVSLPAGKGLVYVRGIRWTKGHFRVGSFASGLAECVKTHPGSGEIPSLSGMQMNLKNTWTT